jgi:hypothetical protein
MKYIAPTVLAGLFSCPHCSAIAQQKWWYIDWDGDRYSDPDSCALRIGLCTHCNNHTLWVSQSMLYPTSGTAPLPNVEMPQTVKEYYSEAAEIFSKSPRAAAALLRLGIQVLCKELGEEGKNINSDIAALVTKGLPDVVQQSLDVVRVTGNDAVHPGQIDTDDPEIIASLFDLVNIIVEYMIAMPKRVSGLYGNLPANSLAAIQKRDT